MTRGEKLLTRLRRLLGLFLLLLGGSMPRLWLPPGQTPQIPWLEFLIPTPGWIDWIGIGLVCVGALGLALGPSTTRVTSACSLGTLIGAIALILLDQHRLQPWAYQFVLLLTILALVPDRLGLRLIRLLVISIYLWSGLSKLDPLFPEAHGQLLLEGLERGLGFSTALWPAKAKALIPWSFAGGEILIGLLLLIPKTRRLGLLASLAMHTLLIVALGPWGLDHEPGVLLWNGFFLGQNLVLFTFSADLALAERSTGSGNDPPDCDQSEGPAGSTLLFSVRSATAIIVTLLAILLPAGESLGWSDHWPSWSVYSSRPAIVTVKIGERAADRLPQELQTLLSSPRPFETTRKLNLDSWSYRALNCPPYPQTRWRLAVALAVAEQAEFGEDITVTVSMRTGWWNKERKESMLSGTTSIQNRCQEFWLNTTPRIIRGDRD